MRTILAIESALGAVLCGVFVGRYLAVRGWWRSQAGRHIMTMTALLGVMLCTFAAGRLVGGLPSWVWVLELAALDVVLLGRLYLFHIAMREEDEMVLFVDKRAILTDARRRALRTLLQGLLLDVATAVIAVLTVALTNVSWTREWWLGLGGLLVKSVSTAVMSYIARRVVPPVT